MKKNKKTFDCVEFKRKSQTKIFKKIKNLSSEDEILYFEKSALASPLGNWWREVSKAKTIKGGGLQKKKQNNASPGRYLSY